MIGSLTTDYKKGLKLKEILNNKKMIKYSENISPVFGYHQIIFMYADDNMKEINKNSMIKDGWAVVDGQDRMFLANNFYGDEDYKDTLVPIGIYEKQIKNVFAE